MSLLEQPSTLLALSAALLAFLLGFYSLVGKERRSPYISSLIYYPILLLMATGVLAFAAEMARPQGLGGVAGPYLGFAACITFLVALVVTTRDVLKIVTRDLLLRDDRWWDSIPGVKRIRKWFARRGWRRTSRKGKTYETTAIELPRDVIKNVAEYLGYTGSENVFDEVAKGPTESQSFSILRTIENHRESLDCLVNAAMMFLKKGFYVQITTCIRNPFEIGKMLENVWRVSDQQEDWNEARSRVILVDAYYPHFGFKDSTHVVAKAATEDGIGISCIESGPSFAGIHSASASAFNKTKQRIKERIGSEAARPPCLVLYEGLMALIDLESAEQYNVFVRHVIPSERMWGGMLTVFLENEIFRSYLGSLLECVDIDILKGRGDELPANETRELS